MKLAKNILKKFFDIAFLGELFCMCRLSDFKLSYGRIYLGNKLKESIGWIYWDKETMGLVEVKD